MTAALAALTVALVFSPPRDALDTFITMPVYLVAGSVIAVAAWQPNWLLPLRGLIVAVATATGGMAVSTLFVAREYYCCSLTITQHIGYPHGWLRRSATYNLPGVYGDWDDAPMTSSFDQDAVWYVPPFSLFGDITFWLCAGIILVTAVRVARRSQPGRP